MIRPLEFGARALLRSCLNRSCRGFAVAAACGALPSPLRGGSGVGGLDSARCLAPPPRPPPQGGSERTAVVATAELPQGPSGQRGPALRPHWYPTGNGFGSTRSAVS